MLPLFSEVTDHSDPYGWVVAGIIAILGAIGTFWTRLRKTKTDDSTAAITHQGVIIKGWERYAARQDERIKAFETERAEFEKARWEESAKRENASRAEIGLLWQAHRETLAREERCQMRLEWLRQVLIEHQIEVPEWPLSEET